jgi:hypothetical protein
MANNLDGTAIEVGDLASPEFQQLFEHIPSIGSHVER